jgi:hypothetical protein
MRLTIKINLKFRREKGRKEREEKVDVTAPTRACRQEKIRRRCINLSFEKKGHFIKFPYTN